VAVPGEIAGYWEAHQKFGKLAWARLFEPTIELCKNGMVVGIPLGRALADQRKNIREEPSLK
jgi:gamma-glutamyltranspeptidase/glutathione hydrolase/leukotriene-C4 hydrolase